MGYQSFDVLSKERIKTQAAQALALLPTSVRSASGSTGWMHNAASQRHRRTPGDFVHRPRFIDFVKSSRQLDLNRFEITPARR